MHGEEMKTVIAAATLALSLAASAQAPQDPGALIGAQREAMQALAAMDGVWRGPAWTLMPNGEKRTVTQTERIGPFLDGSVKVIEGRGYRDDGRVGFNAFGIISFDPTTRAYTMRSYAQGHSGDFALKPTADGYEWELPMGPAKIRYVATIRDGTLREIGHRIVEGREPLQIFEMNLKRVGDTAWPAADPVPPR
jgi:hypothetical protein